MSELVLAGNFTFPNDIPVSDHVKDLIQKMLTKNAKNRITAEEALRHPWFAAIPKKGESKNNSKEEEIEIVLSPIREVSSAIPISDTVISSNTTKETITTHTFSQSSYNLSNSMNSSSGCSITTTISDSLTTTTTTNTTNSDSLTSLISTSSAFSSPQTTINGLSAEEKNKIRHTLNKAVDVVRVDEDGINNITIIPAEQSSLWISRTKKRL